MKNFISLTVYMILMVAILLPFFTCGWGFRIKSEIHVGFNGKASSGMKKSYVIQKEGVGDKRKELDATGSSLPDCSHACGPCFPCKRVMVSFKCSIAESCPIVYRCMCKGRYFHVPSN